MVAQQAVRSALVAVLIPAALAAQTVRGTVMDAASRTPFVGVVVVLTDSAGTAVARALSNQRGEFTVSVTRPGSYRLRTLRIGYQPQVSEVIQLATGQTREIALTPASVPILLDTIQVVGRNACRQGVRDQASESWEQARTALTAAQLTTRTAGIDATVLLYQRVLEQNSDRIRSQQTQIRSGLSTATWRSARADSLRRYGYVVEDKDGWTSYFAPDLAILLSREFVEDHCLRMTTGDDRSLVGVAFTPTRDRENVPEIRGTVWLDRRSLELRRLELRYVNLDEAQESVAGAEMDFVRMTNGGWVIGHWAIRMPVMEIPSLGAGGMRVTGRRPEPRVVEVRVAGGELIAVTRSGDTLWASRPLVLSGEVTDSVSGRTIAGARLKITGTELAATTDSRGRFSIEGLLRGQYTLEVRTPSLDSMRAVHRAGFTFLDAARSLEVRVPSGAGLMAMLCPGERYARNADFGVVFGVATVLGDSVPAGNLRVTAEWRDFAFRQEGNRTIVDRPRRFLSARTNADGAFRLCGVPVNSDLLLNVEGDSVSAAEVAVKIPVGQKFARADLILSYSMERQATFTGVVLDDAKQPIPDAEVVLPRLVRSTLTDERGRFRLSDVDPGEQRLIVRRMGYGALDTALVFSPGKTLERSVFLTKVAVLDTVSVSVLRLPPEFEEHRRLGLGHFLTRADLARVEHASMAAVLREIPGLQVLRELSGRQYVATNRIRQAPDGRGGDPIFGLVRGCLSHVYLDNMLVFSGKELEEKFDINSISPDRVEAVEYYSNALQLPMKYSTRDARCGVLVIHTRKAK